MFHAAGFLILLHLTLLLFMVKFLLECQAIYLWLVKNDVGILSCDNEPYVPYLMFVDDVLILFQLLSKLAIIKELVNKYAR